MGMLPTRLRRNSRRQEVGRRFPGHCARVPGHHCSVPACDAADIECAHVRSGTDGGVGIKPSDGWAVSLCSAHHAEQHRIGEAPFEKAYAVSLRALAMAFAEMSPHHQKWAV